MIFGTPPPMDIIGHVAAGPDHLAAALGPEIVLIKSNPKFLGYITPCKSRMSSELLFLSQSILLLATAECHQNYYSFPRVYYSLQQKNVIRTSILLLVFITPCKSRMSLEPLFLSQGILLLATAECHQNLYSSLRVYCSLQQQNVTRTIIPLLGNIAPCISRMSSEPLFLSYGLLLLVSCKNNQ